MTIDKQRMNQIIKEELHRALKHRGLNEGGPGEYYIGSDPVMRAQADFDRDEYLARQERDLALAARTARPRSRIGSAADHPMADIYRQQMADLEQFLEADADGHDHLREADDDMDMDMPDSDDDEMGFEVEDEDMGEMMPGMEPVGEEIDWSQFEDVGADELYDAFNNAIKQLREENPDDEPTAEAVVALMQDMLAAPEEEDAEGESEEMEPEMAGGDEPLNEWIKRTNLLAGTRRR